MSDPVPGAGGPGPRAGESQPREAEAASGAPGVRTVAGAPEVRGFADRVASVLGQAADHLESAASAVGAAVGATVRRYDERPGARVRRVRRLGSVPLPFLYELHPDARGWTPRELGVETIDVADIAGTAVGGAQQRGSDFLPLKPFRSLNWSARWQRLRQASDRLAILPPIDVLRVGERYWVLDGHNRVALALYNGQGSIDADVTELHDPARPGSGQAESFASFAEDSRELRAAVTRSGSDRSPVARPEPTLPSIEPAPEPAPDAESPA